MTLRHILIILSVAGAVVLLLVGGFFAVYHYDRTLIGFQNDTTIIRQDTFYVEPTLKITEFKLRHLEKEQELKETYMIEKDSLDKLRLRLLDSINLLETRFSTYSDTLAQSHRNYEDAEKAKNALLDSLDKLYRQYKDALSKYELKKRFAEDQSRYIELRKDSLQMKNFQEFARLYNNADPAFVARILERLDERDAAKLLKMMSTKKAGKVIEAMSPENAAAILILGSTK